MAKCNCGHTESRHGGYNLVSSDASCRVRGCLCDWYVERATVSAGKRVRKPYSLQFLQDGSSIRSSLTICQVERRLVRFYASDRTADLSIDEAKSLRDWLDRAIAWLEDKP